MSGQGLRVVLLMTYYFVVIDGLVFEKSYCTTFVIDVEELTTLNGTDKRVGDRRWYGGAAQTFCGVCIFPFKRRNYFGEQYLSYKFSNAHPTNDMVYRNFWGGWTVE